MAAVCVTNVVGGTVDDVLMPRSYPVDPATVVQLKSAETVVMLLTTILAAATVEHVAVVN